jgi:transmembrane sensor
MDQHVDWERLARYVTDQCSPDEAAEVERWIALDATRRTAVRDMQAIWANAQVAPTGWDVARAWQELSPKLDRVGVGEPIPTRVTRPWFTPAWGLRIAAALAVLVGGGLLYRSFLLSRPAAPREYVTARGQRAEFRLKDGTRVVLSVASRLRVPADYGARERSLYLEGEAYFDVRHDARRRFVVQTAHAATEDLGTRFDVRAYEGDSTVQVVVAEGRVALQTGARDTLVTPGQLGVATAGGALVVRDRVDVDRYLGWTAGRLTFDNTPLAEALPQLGRWYDLDLRLGDRSLASLPLTATFKDQTTTQVLDLVAQALGLRLERAGRVVTFYRNRSR